MDGQPKEETPLTVEALLRILNAPGCMTTAGYMGTCERVIRFDYFKIALESLRDSSRQ